MPTPHPLNLSLLLHAGIPSPQVCGLRAPVSCQATPTHSVHPLPPRPPSTPLPPQQLHQPAAAEHEVSLLLRRRSLNVISGEAYARWHGISESATDQIDERVANAAVAGVAVGDVVTRGDRVSIVFVRKLDG